MASMGKTKGLISIWHDDFFQVCEQIHNRHFLVVIGKVTEVEKCYGFINIYYLNEESLKQNLCEELEQLMRSKNILWCLGEDFNIIRNKQKMVGKEGIRRLEEKFNEFINNLALVDLELTRDRYKWCDFRDGWAFSRLNRFY